MTLKEKKIKIDRIINLFEKIKKKITAKKKVLIVIKIKKINFKIFNILDKYIIKKLFIIYLFIFISIIIVFFVINIIELADDAIENGVRFSVVLNYVIFSMPEILNFIFPVSILTTVLLTFSIMSKNNEIVAIQVSGISLYRIVLPAIFFGLAISTFAFFIQENITPEANKKALVLFNKIHKRNKKIKNELRRSWAINDSGQFFFYQNYNKKTGLFYNFGVLELDKNFKLKRRIYSKYAKWSDNNQLELQHGFIKEFKDNNPIGYKNFGPYIINTNLTKENFISRSKKLQPLISQFKDFNRYKIELPGNRFIFYEKFNNTKNELTNFTLALYDGGFRLEKLIYSKTGKWTNRSEIILKDANIKIFNKNSSPILKPVFKPITIKIPDGKDFFKKKIISSEYMNIHEIKKYIKYLKKSNSDTVRYEAKLYYKYAFPVSSLIMVLLAIPFAFLMGNKGAVHGIGFAVGFSMIYWSAFGIFSALGSAAILSPFISAFAPLLIFGTVSLFAFFNLKT
jgi:lipopolysaccharide export LptBFGC system permease protein LptF